MSVASAKLTAALASASDIQFRLGAACAVHAASAYATGIDYVLVSAVGIVQSARPILKKSIADLTSTVSVNNVTFCKRLSDVCTAVALARGALTKGRTDGTSISTTAWCAVGKHCDSAAHTSVHNTFGVAKRTEDPVRATHLMQAVLVKNIVDYCAVSARVTYGATAQPDTAALTADYSTVQLVKAVHSGAAAHTNVGHAVVKNLRDVVSAHTLVTVTNAPTRVVGDYGGAADASHYAFIKVISDGVGVFSRCRRDYMRTPASSVAADATDVRKQCGLGGSEYSAAHDMVGAAVGKRITDSARAASSSVCGVRPAANSDIGNLTFGLSAFGV